ncbi:RICIN domain-containing protein [Streptomyces tricolor]
MSARGSVRRLLRTRPTRVLAAALLAVAVVSAAVWWSVRDSGSPSGPGSGRLPSGQVLLRPLGSPGLCVTDGQAPDGRYRSLVAVQRPCDETAPQTTTLDPVGDTAHRIVWYRPDQGKGCLKALTSGAGAGLLEPWEACDQTTAFRFVPAESREDRKTGTSGTSGTAAGRSYLIKVPGGKCAGIRDGSTEEGAEVVVEPCTGADAQLFVVQAAP